MCMSVCVTDLQLQWMCVLSVQGVEWGSMCVSMYLLVCTNVVAHGCMTPTMLSQTQTVVLSEIWQKLWLFYPPAHPITHTHYLTDSGFNDSHFRSST